MASPVRITKHGEPHAYIAPELIVEIAASTALIDCHKKMHIYRHNGVQ